MSDVTERADPYRVLAALRELATGSLVHGITAAVCKDMAEELNAYLCLAAHDTSGVNDKGPGMPSTTPAVQSGWPTEAIERVKAYIAWLDGDDDAERPLLWTTPGKKSGDLRAILALLPSLTEGETNEV
jgi:hypothetical protein